MTFHARRARISQLMRPHQPEDRRHYQRFEQHGLMVRVGQKLHEVHDVSVGGIRIDLVDAPVGADLVLTLFPRDGRQLDVSQSMAARGQVVGHTGTCTRIQFVTMSFTLAKFLIQHLARRNGVQPYIFK